jgi:hypothetical protein
MYARLAVAGAAVVCASVLLLVALPGVTPFEVVNCSAGVVEPSSGGPFCFNSVNPVYPVVFLFQVAGTVVFFFGKFGKRFIVNPVFVAGMIALEYGLSGVVSGTLDAQRASTFSPVIFAPLVVIGAGAISLQTVRRLRRPRQPTSR